MSTLAPEVCIVAPGEEERDPVGHARRRRAITVALGIATPVILIALWELAANLGWIETRFFPGPSKIFVTAVEMIQSGMLAADLWATTQAILIGFSFGLVIGVAFGVMLGVSWSIRASLEPLFSALYTIPKLALLPLLLLIFGLGDMPKFILVAIGVFFIIWISVLEAIGDIPFGYREAAESFGVRGWSRFVNVTMPAITPQLFTAIRIAMGNAVLLVVGIEFVNGDSGLGFRIWHSWSLFATPRMYVGIVVVALLGFLLTLLIRVLGRLIIRWGPRAGR